LALRIALISSVKRLLTGEMRAQLELAGRSILSWQVDSALEAGCERVICICDAAAPHILEQQHRLENAGLGFHTVRSPLQIVGLVKPDDRILMILDGLIPSGGAFPPDQSADDAKQHAIFTVPSDHSLSNSHPEDFERIDRDRHWAGLAWIPGNAASGLECMPGDGDAMSLLLRLGLQDEAPCEPLPSELLQSDQWVLASDSQSVEKRAQMLLTANAPNGPWAGPFASLANLAMRASGPFWLKSGGIVAAAVTIALVAIAVGLAWLGYAAAGLATAVFAAFLAKVVAAASSLRSAISSHLAKQTFSRLVEPVVACGSTAVLIFAHTGSFGWSMQLAIPVFAVGLAIVAGRDPNAQLRAFWRDSPTHLGIFLIASLTGFLNETLLVFALGALLQLMLRISLKSDSV
jgi:hypothetical protein